MHQTDHFKTTGKWLIMPVVVFLHTGFLYAQGNPTYPANIETKIKQVENSLGSDVMLEGDSAWNVLQRIKYYKIPGVSIAVIQNRKMEWARAYGLADVATDTKATTQTLYQAASLSKSLNAVGALRLVQEQKIDLNADINRYLVSWKFPYDSLSGGKQISLRNLLSHTAGLTIHGFPGYDTGDTIPSVIQVLEGKSPANTRAVRSQFAPGLKVQYSGGGTTISQLIVTDITKQRYEDYMWEKVLQPLGMTSSFYNQPPLSSRRNDVATGYAASGKEIKGKYHVYPEKGAAGLWTNPTDFSKYIIETQLAYSGQSDKVLNREMTRLRLTPFLENAALGVFVVTKGGDTYFTHGGSNEGFRCEYYGSIANGNGVIVMVNSDNGSIINEVINSVAKVYGWKGFYMPQTRKKIAVAENTLNSYVGEYQLAPDFILTITNNKGQLTVQPGGQSPEPLYAETETKFFVLAANATLEFIKGADGLIEKCILHQNGREMPAKKIK